MAYQEITENKTIYVDSAGGHFTLDEDNLYVGNKSTTTGSVVGNRDKNEITYYFDPEVSWVTEVSFTNAVDLTNTAKTINVRLNKNNNITERSATLKLKGMSSSAKYITIILEGDSGTFVPGILSTIHLYFGYKSLNNNLPIQIGTLSNTKFYFKDVSGDIMHNTNNQVINGTSIDCFDCNITFNNDNDQFSGRLTDTTTSGEHITHFCKYTAEGDQWNNTISTPIIYSYLKENSITALICFYYT